MYSRADMWTCLRRSPAGFEREAYAPEVLKLGASGLVTDAEHERAREHSWVSASEGEDELTRAA